MNRTSDYKLNLETIGTLTHIEALKQGLHANDLSHISEDYRGHQRMSLKIQMRDYLPPVQEAPGWLECCFGGDVGGGSESWRPPRWDGSGASSDRIFSAEP
ncbi:MAG TPA: hypothetical protein PK659_04975 [Methanothrix sp.]|nr:hypothetical protein [Methanothrix sp.]HOK58267.1 hypothetical protein [Methanothrix sp.]HOL43591.1 hypothetical protein [Methanothrix sp.]HPO89066.1 hypothetical protein [Methanothrix sp.]